MAFAESRGCRIYYRLEGSPDKPLLVLVHALGTDHGLWDPQMPSLLRYFRVLRPDLRGHGASDAPAGDYSMEQLAEDVLATVPGECFSYCGISLGGMVGQWLAAHRSERVERLVLANTSPRVAEPEMFEVARQVILREGASVIEPDVMHRFFTSPSHPAAASTRTTLLQTDPVGLAGCCAAIRDMDHRPLLTSIAMPTLIIGSDTDTSTPWDGQGDVLASQIAGARVVKLISAHLSNLERPAAFTQALLDFLLPAPSADPLEAGFAIRRTVLGDAHVDRAIANTTDFTRDFQELITRYAWGTIWTRPGLDPATRRLLVLSVTAALGRWEEFRLHVRTGLDAELEPETLKEALMQLAIYAGVPASNSAFNIAREEIAREREAPSTSSRAADHP